MRILGIETSCDETAAALIEAKGGNIKVVSNAVSSQIKIHRQYGGVIPELAARNHIKNILPVINTAIKTSLMFPLLTKDGVPQYCGTGEVMADAIAVTYGPGLIPSLLIGIETAKALAYAWNKPIIGVNHLVGHIYSNFIGNDKKIKFPALVLIVSGGHTELVLMRGHFKFKLLGQTRDDAAGEAFDKAAKIMELGYPGGPAIAKQADLYNKNLILDLRFKILDLRLPRPMINESSCDFSFSGLKTALLYKIQKDKAWRQKIPAYCAEFQQAIIDVLVSKTIKAAKKHKVKSVMLSGGVAANTELRRQLGQAAAQSLAKVEYFTPDLKYTTDNAAMIAAAGYFLVRRSFNEGGLIKNKEALKHKSIKTNKRQKNIKKNIKVDCNAGFTS